MAKALSGAGHLAYLQGDHQALGGLAREGLRWARRAADRELIALALMLRIVDAVTAGDLEEATALSREARAQAGEADGWLLAWVLLACGLVEQARGDPERDYALLSEGLPRAEEAGDPWLRGIFLSNLGAIDLEHGNCELAGARLRQSLILFRGVGEKAGLTQSLGGWRRSRRRGGDPGAPPGCWERRHHSARRWAPAARPRAGRFSSAG
jgi:ATP/maltotriose-dependent transcriptional regulator MalT